MITFGADPEAILWDLSRGRAVGASESHFPPYNAFAGKDINEAKWKCDGASYTLELEIPPFTNPEVGIELIRDAISRLNSKGYDFIAGAIVNEMCLGGHIHIGYKKDRYGLVKVLDETVGNMSYLVCGKQQWDRSKSGHGYGKYNASRDKTHGFEYRTPPSWLISEEWALCFLGMTYIVVHSYIEDKYKVSAKRNELWQKRDKLSKRTRVMRNLQFYQKEFPHIYNNRWLAPFWRVCKEKQTWKSTKVASPDFLSSKRWRL